MGLEEETEGGEEDGGDEGALDEGEEGDVGRVKILVEYLEQLRGDLDKVLGLATKVLLVDLCGHVLASLRRLQCLVDLCVEPEEQTLFLVSIAQKDVEGAAGTAVIKAIFELQILHLLADLLQVVLFSFDDCCVDRCGVFLFKPFVPS